MGQNFLRDDIESGAYFIKARRWYNDVFLSSIKYNALLFGVIISVMLISLSVAYSIYNVFPITEPVQVVVPMENTLNFTPVIKDISSVDRSAKEVIIAYLAEKYISAREVYDPKTFRKNYYFIMRSTNKALFNAYYDSISDLKDKNNPSALYKSGFRDKIRVLSYFYDDKNDFISVKYLKETYNLNTGEVFSPKFDAKMSFVTSAYDFNISKNTRFNFIVTNYETAKIKN